jgi:hypothetical protein
MIWGIEKPVGVIEVLPQAFDPQGQGTLNLPKGFSFSMPESIFAELFKQRDSRVEIDER